MVGYLHWPLSVVHRDIKPENILLSAAGHVKLVDFGLARQLMHDERCHTVCGTPDYMAPELINKTGHGREVRNLSGVHGEILRKLTRVDARDRSTFGRWGCYSSRSSSASARLCRGAGTRRRCTRTSSAASSSSRSPAAFDLKPCLKLVAVAMGRKAIQTPLRIFHY